MPNCDTCGTPLSGDDPFVVCPRCLFSGALQPDPVPAPQLHPPQHPTPETRLPLLSPSEFGARYELQERLGHGGQGEILKAWDLRLRRSVAMKRLSATGSHPGTIRSRFLAEAQIAGQLQHPGILPVHDIGLDPDGRLFYTTDVLPGTTLEDVFRQARDAADPHHARAHSLELLIRVAEIVAHAHSRGVIHRDLKPANILVGAFGDLRVIDWGSAFVSPSARRSFDLDPTAPNPEPVHTDRSEALHADPRSPLATSQSGQPITALFTPPEILAGSTREPDPTADVYALGIMLYEVCAGRKPYSNTLGLLPRSDDLKRLVSQRPPDPVRSLQPSLPRDLAAICEKAIARDPSRRYSDTVLLAADLRAFLELRPVSARSAGWLGEAELWTRRHSRAVLAGSLTVALVALIGAVALRANAERRRAQAESARVDADRRIAVQYQMIRESELAARAGKWPQVLQALEKAQAEGYADTFELGLRRHEAFVILWNPEQAQAELDRLLQLPNLTSPQRALLTLRLGEFELFGPNTIDAGTRHVQEALRIGLDPIEHGFAQGILASNTTLALQLFQETLRRNPFHHGAHRHSLGLEMLMGQREPLNAHIQVIRGLYPEDPSPTFAHALQLACDGQTEPARQALAPLRQSLDPQAFDLLDTVIQLFGEGHAIFDIQVYLHERPMPPGFAELLQSKALNLTFVGSLLNPSASSRRLARMPRLPCLKPGIEAGLAALRGFFADSETNPTTALDHLQQAWSIHREALLPYAAAILRERSLDTNATPPTPFLSTQATLFDMAARSFSCIPSLPRLATYRAAETHLDLVDRGGTTNAQACLDLVLRAASFPDLSHGELRGYFLTARELGAASLANELFARWERTFPNDPWLRRARIRQYATTGALGPALRELQSLLADHPHDQAALQRQQAVLEELHRLAREFPPAPTAPAPR